MNTVENIKKICTERKIAISALERACGLSNGYIRSLKKGNVPSDKLFIIAKYLEVPAEKLALGDDLTKTIRDQIGIISGEVNVEEEYPSFLTKQEISIINMYRKIDEKSKRIIFNTLKNTYNDEMAEKKEPSSESISKVG